MMIKESNQLIQWKHRHMEDLVSPKENIKCNNTIKQYKND